MLYIFREEEWKCRKENQNESGIQEEQHKCEIFIGALFNIRKSGLL